MRSLLLFLLAVMCAINALFAQERIISNPDIEFTTSGLYHINKIETTDQETRLSILCTFIPGWWINFSKETFIKVSGTDDRLLIRDMVGGTVGERITMPASGDSAVVLVFPPLPRTAERIDFAEDGKEVVFGLSLTRSQETAAVGTEVPATVQSWLNQATAESKVTSLVDYGSSAFFTRDTARLVGYIKGYDPRAGFSTGMVYAENVIANEDHPIVVQVYKDGRFEATIPLLHPTHTAVVFERRWIPFYIEPGQTLSMVLDWDEFLEADRKRNIRFAFNNIVFGGPAAVINDQLLKAELPELDHRALENKQKTMVPDEFKRQQMAAWDAETERLEQLLAQNNWLPQTKTLLRHELALAYAAYLYDFLLSRDYYSKQDSTNDVLKVPVGQEYDNFIGRLPLDDPSLLVSKTFATFINRFEFSKTFSDVYRIVNRVGQPEKSLEEYLFTELGLTPTGDDSAFIAMQRTINTRLNQTDVTESDREELLAAFSEKAKAFHERYAEQSEAYVTKYVKSQNPVGPVDRAMLYWTIKDSLLQSEYGLATNFTYEVAKVRSLDAVFKQQLSEKDDGRVFLTAFDEGLHHPFLKGEAEHLFHNAYPETHREAYELPRGKATDIFRQIIDPHKGKIVFVDFWATTCGPCVGSIKHHRNTRTKYRDNPDFEFVFITSENESPAVAYDDFVGEQELRFTHRLSADDFRYLRQLFNFNGIPRYVVIDRDGSVMNDDFAMHNFETELKKIIHQIETEE